MPFDPNTAVLAKPRFDPSTARPVSAPESDTEFILRTTPELMAPAPQESYISKRTGGLVKLRGDEGFQVAETGLLPGQIARYIGESPELQAMGVRMGAAIPGSVIGAELGAPLGPIGSLVGAGIGGMTAAMGIEPLATRITPRDETAGEQLANVAQWAIPGSGRLPSRIDQALLESAIGAGQGQIYATTQSLADYGRLPTIEEAFPMVGGGMVLGGALGGIQNPTRVVPEIDPIQARPLIGTNIEPTELELMRRALAEPSLPQPTELVPEELSMMAAARGDVLTDAVATSEAASQQRIRALGERMMGPTTPEQKLQILDQEVRLQKDYLTDAEQRGALDLKQELQRQIKSQKMLEQAANAEQKAVAEQQKMLEAAQQPPEIPKSAQILAEPSANPPSLANVATEIGTQTSPYALQAELNKLTSASTQPQTAPIGIAQQVAAMDADAFRKWGSEIEGGFTPKAYEIGIAVIGNSSAIDELKAARTAAEEEVAVAREAMRGGDETAIDTASSLAAKVQFFSEAIGAAENTGSAATADVVKAAHVASAPTAEPVAIAVAASPRSAEQRLNDAGMGLPPVSSMSREAKRAELDAAGITEYNGKPLDAANPAQISAAVGKLRRGELGSERGAISPRALAPIASSGAGFSAGWMTAPDKQEDETDEQYQARRLARAAAFSVGGGIGLPAITALGRLRPSRSILAPKTSNPSLASARKALAAEPAAKKSMFDVLVDAKNDFIFRMNTAAAPIGSDLQRPIYEAAGKKFNKGKYYDLEDRFEDLSGAQVKAQQEASPLYNLVHSIPSKLRPRLSEYLFLRRVQDRLERIPLETQRLQDAVGIAQAELDAAKQAHKGSKTLGNAKQVEESKLALSSAIKRLNEEGERLRVAGWSLDDPAQNNPADALNALQAEVGQQNYQSLDDAATAYQKIMADNLRKDYEAGFLEKGVYDAITSESKFYSPFKVMKYYEDDQPFSSGGGRRTTSVKPDYQAITGIDDDEFRVANPLIPSYEQLYKSSIKRQKNEFLRRVASLAALDKTGDFIKVVKDGDAARSGFDAIGFWRNGEKVRMEVPEKVADVLNDKNGFMSVANRMSFLRGLTLANSVFKFGATGAQIPFMLSNFLVFDPARAAIMGKYGVKNPADLVKFFMLDYPVGLYNAARVSFGPSIDRVTMGATNLGTPNELGERWLKSGAAQSTFSQIFTPEAFERQLPTDRTLSRIAMDEKFGLQTLLNLSARVSNTLEATPKIASLRRALSQNNYDQAVTSQTASGGISLTKKVNFSSLTKDQQRRAMEEISHELRNYAGSPDFSRMGADMPLLNIVLPFTNARWQGFVADAGRLANQRTPEGRAALARLSAMAAFPAAALMWWNLKPENKDDYYQIPERERMRGYFIPLYEDAEGDATVMSQSFVNGSLVDNKPAYKDVDGTSIRQYRVIPKRETPQVVANLTEGFVRWTEQDAKEAFKGLGDTVMQTALPVSLEGDTAEERLASMVAGVTPPIRLTAEIAANRDFFRRRDIVPESMAKAAPEEQYRDSTPMVYRDAANAMPDDLPKSLRSPLALQKITEDMTGGFVRQFTERPDKPERSFSDRATSRFERSDYVDESSRRRARDVAVQEYETERVRNGRTADKIADLIVKNNDAEYTAAIISAGMEKGIITPAVARAIESKLREAGKKYGNEESSIANYIPKGARARYYAERLADMTETEGNEYIRQQHEARLLDREIMAALIKLNPQPKK